MKKNFVIFLEGVVKPSVLDQVQMIEEANALHLQILDQENQSKQQEQLQARVLLLIKNECFLETCFSFLIHCWPLRARHESWHKNKNEQIEKM